MVVVDGGSRKLVLRGDLLTGELLDIGLCHVTHGHHAYGLPDTETDTRGQTTVQTADAVGVVDVLEGVADSHLLGPVGVVLLGLHFDTDDLNGLVPCGQTTTQRTGQDLLPRGQLLSFRLAVGLADTLLGQTRQTEARAPVGHLANGDGVDTTVDTADTLTAVDVHEGGPGALGSLAGGGSLVLGDLDRLHASAEAHGGIGLRDTTGDTTGNTTDKLGTASGAGVVLGLGGDEQEDGTLGGSLNPGPGDQTLVDCGR